ncbi:MAG: hypothetical protein KA327_04780 [Pseudarcicella sp.]|nr:hypothetical protein [Pseudarcicella sp.]
MKLKEFKTALSKLQKIDFELENGTAIPAHFHITEIGNINKKYIDCGGTFREDNTINFQLWYANDTAHRLSTTKLLEIISMAEEQLNLDNNDIEVEYQHQTIGKYDLVYFEEKFILINKQTQCLALDACGIQSTIVNIPQPSNTCTPGGGCC